MKENKWVRLLAHMTGLVKQELLLQNEYLAAENRILRAGITSHPDQAWMQQTARNATGEAWGFLDQRRYALHDREHKVLFALPSDAEGWRHKTNSTSGPQPEPERVCRKDRPGSRIRRRERLGGLLKYYSYAA